MKKPFLAALLLSSPLAAQEFPLDKIILEALALSKIPGCAVTIAKGDEILLCKGYGVKQLKNAEGNAIDTHTLFPIASLTKLFTAAGVGLLEEQGILTLDTPIAKFYPLALSDPYASSHLTFRDCLSLRSGLPGPSTYDLLYSDPNVQRQTLLENILPALPFPLGFRSGFSYQNLLYLLVSPPLTPSYETFLQKQLLEPLEMWDTTASFSRLQSRYNKASPYVWKIDHYEEVPYENLDAFLPACGLSSTAHDMSHFLLFLLNKGTHRAQKIADPSTLEQIFTPQTVATTEEFTGSSTHHDILFPHSQFLTYGLGCFIHDYRGIKMMQAPGLTDGFSSVLALVPSLNLGIFIAVNAEATAFTHSLLYQFIDAFLD